MTRMKNAAVAVSIILLVSAASNIYVYVSLNNRNNDLQNQIAEVTSKNANLQEQNDSLQNIISILQNKYGALALLDMGNAPNLITSLGATDVRIPSMIHPGTFPNSRLYIEGTVINAGTETAYNCRLNVTLYRGNSVVENTNISLGTMEGGAIANVSSNIAYSGDPLTDWDIIPEFDVIK